MKSKIVAATMAACLAGCQSDEYVRSQPPLATYSSSRPLDAAVACLIPALGESYSAAAISNFRFVGQVINPGAEYDIVPIDGFVNGHYLFTVNVKRSGSGAQITLYQGQVVLPNLSEAMKNGINRCL